MNVITFAEGRIGNEMFSITSGKYYADKHQANFFIIPRHYNYAVRMRPKMFPDIEMVGDLSRFKFVSSKTEIDSVTYCPITNYDNSQNIFILGYRQSPRYWDNDIEYAHKLWDKPEVVEILKNLYSDADLSNCVSLHIRRIDYGVDDQSNGEEMKSYLGVQTMTYYRNCMAKFPEGTKFLILSNNIDWCKEEFKGDNFIFADRMNEQLEPYGKELADLFLPTLCKGNIISNSTFCWWSAYLNRNAEMVCYPTPFFRYTKSMDIIPNDPRWVAVKADYEP